mgnify:CR=1 FL=1
MMRFVDNKVQWQISQLAGIDYVPCPDCRDCNGTGEADSGGIMPWGEPAMIRCHCYPLVAVAAFKDVFSHPPLPGVPLLLMRTKSEKGLPLFKVVAEWDESDYPAYTKYLENPVGE